MAKYEFDKAKFEEWKRLQEQSLEIQEKMNSSVSGYLESIKKIKELQKNIQFIEKQVTKLKEEQLKAAKDLKDNEDKLAKATSKKDAAEIKALKEKEKELKKILAAKTMNVNMADKELTSLKKQNEVLVDSAKQANKISAGFNSSVGFLKKIPGLIQNGWGRLKGTGIFEMDKEIRNAVRSMAGGQKTYNNMFNTITKAAETTTMWGVGVKDLAIMQRGYSEAIGRSVMLTESGYKAMAGMAEGTGLGKEFAVQMAGELDNFNISAERSATIVEDTMNNAAKLGVNGAAALKSFQNNLKLAQRFNFKGGIAGLAKFSAEAAKLKLDMQGIAGMAEKVFRPEGAIEMAAELTTLGGKFAAIGDPMQLMFQARNDPEQFAKNIGKATAEFGEFNKKTGEFQIKGGLALDRMREISRITGISVEELQKMAEAQAKVEEVGKTVKGGMFTQEDTDLISSMAKFDKDKGWVINVKGQDKLVKDLRQTDMANIRAEEKTLEERAQEARTFDETLTDLILQFKQLLLPFAKTLKEALGGPIQELSKKWTAEGFYESLRGFVQGVVDLIPLITNFIKDNPITSAIAAGGLMFGGILFEGAKWIANGLALSAGFLMGTKGLGGGMGMGGAASSIKGPAGGVFGKVGKGVGFGKNFGTAAKSFGAGTAGVLGAAVSGYGEYSENAAMGMSGGENAGRTVSKAAGAGLGGWGGAAAGAALGTALLPGIGTVLGGIIGGIAGGKLGDYVGEGIGDAFYGDERAGRSGGNITRVNDGVMFHPQDKFLKVNDGIQIAGTSVNGNAKLAQELSKNNSSGPSEMTHKFQDLKITIDVNVPGNEKLGTMLANTPEFIRRINEAINREIAMTAGGGKLSGSGAKK
jgi:hypothetical protein